MAHPVSQSMGVIPLRSGHTRSKYMIEWWLVLCLKQNDLRGHVFNLSKVKSTWLQSFLNQFFVICSHLQYCWWLLVISHQHSHNSCKSWVLTLSGEKPLGSRQIRLFIFLCKLLLIQWEVRNCSLIWRIVPGDVPSGSTYLRLLVNP